MTPTYLQDDGGLIDEIARVLALDLPRERRVAELMRAGLRHLRFDTIFDFGSIQLATDPGQAPRRDKAFYVAGWGANPKLKAAWTEDLLVESAKPYIDVVLEKLDAAPGGVLLTDYRGLCVDHDWEDSPYREAYFSPTGFNEAMMYCYRQGPEHLMVGAISTDEATRPITGEDYAKFERFMRFVRPLFDSHLAHDASVFESDMSVPQREVLQLALTGASEKEIAKAICRSRATAHYHLLNLYRRFGVNSRAELIALFLDAKRDRSAACKTPCLPS